MRPDAPFFIGTTRPSTVGWTRIAITLAAGAVAIVLLTQRTQVPALGPSVVIAVIFAGLALWTWMGQSTRFIIDDHGVTVSLGGFLPRRPWPLTDFRTVQLRELPPSSVGVTVGGYGWRRGKAMSSRPDQLRPVGERKIFTTGETQERYRLLVTRSGSMVEIIGRSGTHYLISPTEPEATAEAIDQAIRARR